MPVVLVLTVVCAVLLVQPNAAEPSGSAPKFQATYTSTDANGIAYYNVTSRDDGGTHVLRVLKPTKPARGARPNFLYVLPVEPELGTVYGDGLETLQALNAQNRYNLTIVEPSFGIDPWYADNRKDPALRYETFMTNDLVPWVKRHFGRTGNEQNWLIGFSKSGIGATDLILRHPGVFHLAAAWDFPADMSAYDQFGTSSSQAYGTNANFVANYRLSPAFVDAHRKPFLHKKRLWIGGYRVFRADMTHFDALLRSEGIPHATERPRRMAHRWDSGWMPLALAALHKESAALARKR